MAVSRTNPACVLISWVVHEPTLVNDIPDDRHDFIMSGADKTHVPRLHDLVDKRPAAVVDVHLAGVWEAEKSQHRASYEFITLRPIHLGVLKQRPINAAAAGPRHGG